MVASQSPSSALVDVVYSTDSVCTLTPSWHCAVEPGCVRLGVRYNVGDTWQDGCQYNCECLDTSGTVQCVERWDFCSFHNNDIETMLSLYVWLLYDCDVSWNSHKNFSFKLKLFVCSQWVDKNSSSNMKVFHFWAYHEQMFFHIYVFFFLMKKEMALSTFSLSVCLPVSTHLSACLSVSLFVCQSLPVCLSVFLFC